MLYYKVASTQITHTSGSVSLKMSYLAEQCGEFFYWTLKTKWHCVPGKITSLQNPGGSAFARGLYVFFLQKSNAEGEEHPLYPIYVGQTRRNFKVRFQEHANQGGVIYKVLNNQFPGNQGQWSLFAYTYDVQPVVAKFLESIYLQTFDVALNSEENPPVRDNLDLSHTYHPADVKAEFVQNYKQAAKELNEALVYLED